MTYNNGQSIKYNTSNKPVEIKTKNSTIKFAYDQNGQRYKKVSNGTTTHYLGKTYESIKDSQGNKQDKYYIYADGKVQAIHTNGSDGVLFSIILSQYSTKMINFNAKPFLIQS